MGNAFWTGWVFWISYDTFLDDEITDVHGKRYLQIVMYLRMWRKKEKIYQYDSIGYAGHYTLNRDNVAFANDIRDVKDDNNECCIYNLNPEILIIRIYISERK